MKKSIQYIAVILFSIILFSSCGDAQYQQSESVATASVQGSDDSFSETVKEEEGRDIIKTATISLEVEHLEKSILQLKTFLQPINGYVYNYEINNETYTEDSYQKNMDSMVTVEKIVPRSNLSVRIPIAYADSFINYILNADAEIASLKISDEDVTENVWEKNQVAQVYDNSGTAQKHKGNAKNISYDNNTSIDAIKAKATAAKRLVGLQQHSRQSFVWLIFG